MTYFLTLVFPPVGVLLAGKPMSALLNLLLWCCFIFPAYIHGLAVVKDKKDNKRSKKQTKALTKAMKKQG